MRFLKTNTATRVTVGPFLDVTDGVTPEVALTVTGCHLTLMVDSAGVPTLALDADATASGGNNDMVHVTNDDAGFYDLELAAANVNYVGRAMLAVIDTDVHLPVFHEFMILPAVVYDSLVSGSDTLQVHAIEITDGLVTAATIATGAIDADAIADNAIDAASIATGAITNAKFAAGAIDAAAVADGAIDAATFAAGAINAAAIANGAIDAATFAAGAIDAAAIAANAIDAATFAADVDAEIATMVWNAATASYGGAGTYGQAVEDILEDTGTTLPGLLPAALVGGKIDAHVNDIAANAITAASIANAAIDNATFAADVGSTAFATNVIAQAVFKALDEAITDGVSLTAGGLLEKVRKLSWVVCNKITVTDANGNTVIYKDDSTTAAYTVNAMLTDDSTTTTRLRAA